MTQVVNPQTTDTPVCQKWSELRQGNTLAG
jgi:hypothetical protein